MNNSRIDFKIRDFTPEDSGIWWLFWILGPIGILISFVLKMMMKYSLAKNPKENVGAKIIALTFSQVQFDGGFFKDGLAKTLNISEIKSIEYTSNRPGSLEIFTYTHMPFFIEGNPNDLKPFLTTLKKRGVNIDKKMPLSAKIFYGLLLIICIFLIYGYFKLKEALQENEALGLLLGM